MANDKRRRPVSAAPPLKETPDDGFEDDVQREVYQGNLDIENAAIRDVQKDALIEHLKNRVAVLHRDLILVRAELNRAQATD